MSDVTIVEARYGGTYEGGNWLSFPALPHELEEKYPDWDADDVSCQEFWFSDESASIGRGSSPNNALLDMKRRT